jgi:hypothetical protein
MIHNLRDRKARWRKAMAAVRVLLGVAWIFGLASATVLAQQSSSPGSASGSSTSQGMSIVQQTLTALTGGTPITDVTVTGTYTVTNASGTQSGKIELVATAAGQGRSTVTLPSGTYTETRSVAGGSASMIESGPDGVPHMIATQTAVSPNPAWFCPALLLATAASPSYATSYVGREMLNGEAVHHLAVRWLPGGTASSASEPLTQFWQQATNHDIYLDASSLLPVSITFLLHPYDPSSPSNPLRMYRGNTADRTVQILFSDYQLVQGRPVAFHIHSTMKTGVGNVISDIYVSSVEFNSGAVVSMPTAAN